MATTTRVSLLETMSKALDDWWSAVTTSAGSATTIVDTKLAQLTLDDDYFIGMYVRNVTTGEIRLVTDYVASTTTITHTAMTTAVTNGGTYELHIINPQTKHNALLEASPYSYPKLHVPV